MRLAGVEFTVSPLYRHNREMSFINFSARAINFNRSALIRLAFLLFHRRRRIKLLLSLLLRNCDREKKSTISVNLDWIKKDVTNMSTVVAVPSFQLIPKLNANIMSEIERILDNKPSRPPMISTLALR